MKLYPLNPYTRWDECKEKGDECKEKGVEVVLIRLPCLQGGIYYTYIRPLCPLNKKEIFQDFYFEEKRVLLSIVMELTPTNLLRYHTQVNGGISTRADNSHRLFNLVTK